MRRGILSISFLLLFFVGLGGCGSGGGASQTPPPIELNPRPAVSTVSPDTAAAGGAAFTLTINGSGFVSGSMVNFGGATLPTMFVSPTVLTATVPAADITSLGSLIVDVTNPAPGGGTSATIFFTVVSNIGPGPAIDLLFPSCAPAGEPVQLGVVGTNFAPNSVVRWNGNDRPTTMDAVNGLVAQITASDVAAAGTGAVTVFNPGSGGGSSSPAPFTITSGAVSPQSIAVDPAGKFAYVASGGCSGGAGGYVSMYTINATTGALTSVAPPLPSGDEFTDSVTVAPSGKFAYVVSSGDVWDVDFGSILAYSINPATGALTSTTGGILATGINGSPAFFNSLTFDPSGKFAYAADGGAFPASSFGGSNDVSMYTVDATTEVLTSTGQISAGTNPDSVAVHPSGKFVYVANFGSNNISMFTVDATTGALASAGTIGTGTAPLSIVLDSAGKFAYTANFGSNDLSMYTIDGTTGALTSVGTIAAGTAPVSVVVDPSGKFAYAANFNSSDVSMFTINATTGALTSAGMIAAGQSPTSIAVHPSGKFAYVTNSASNNISMFSIDTATGALTLIGTIGS